MSGIEDPGTPPELPAEYADVYRDAYLRALAEDPVVVVPEASAPAAESDPQQWSSRVWLTIFAVAVVLIVAAFLFGKMVGNDDPPPTQPKAAAAGTPTPTHAGSRSQAATLARVWRGPVRRVTVDSAVASCTAVSGIDSAGRPVSYAASNAVDPDPTSAWRCDGRALHQTITFAIPEGTEIGEVGLVPGYAKTDPVSGTDRYAENNRITRVRWTLADGVEVVQRLDPDPSDRSVQTIRVPRTATGSITLEILRVRPGPRDTTAISSVVLAAAA